MSIVVSSKLTGDTVPVTFDYLSRLQTGDTISSAAFGASVFSGVDASPSSIISGSATISGSKVTQKITGGVAGTIYKINGVAITAAGYTLTLIGYMPVIADPL